MSGWTIKNNTFVDCSIGTWLGGGRRNVVIGNRYEECGLAVHMDNRGTRGGARRANECDDVCAPLSDGCGCNTGAAEWMVTKGAAASKWLARWPYLKGLRNDSLLGQPAFNDISDNTFCKGSFINANENQTAKWHTTVKNNANVTTC